MFQFRRFPTYTYLIQYMLPCGGFPHSEISGSQLICSSPEAYRSLSRPSSAPDAKAFPLRSFMLDLVGANFISLVSVSPRFASCRKLAYSVAPPLKSEPASLGFGFVSSVSHRFGFFFKWSNLKSWSNSFIGSLEV